MNLGRTEILRNTTFGILVAAAAVVGTEPVSAQVPAGEYVDPENGNIYRSITHHITRPVVDERVERQEQTVYRPETVKETRPEHRTTYLPVTQMKWMPYVQNRWNPFRQPTVAYRQVPETRWEARSEVVNRTTMQTRWVAEKRTVEIPHRVVRYETTQKTDLQLVGRRTPPPQIGSNIDPKIAARLRPLDSSVNPGGVTSIATNPYGNAPSRGTLQTGMQPQVLQPTTLYR